MSLRTALVATAFLALLAGCAPGRRQRPSGPQGGPQTGQWSPSLSGPGGASAPGGAAQGSDAQRILDAHNARRAEHCAPPLAWSPAIAATAQRWADALAARGCGLEHSSGPLGENLAAGTAGTMSPERAVDMWFEERASYDFRRGGFSMEAGHFTQVVWKGSRQLGCGTATCGQMQLWVCNYDPPGNMEGAFQSNVGPAGCR